MSSYPQNPRFERWIKSDEPGKDAVAVYLTDDGLIFICAPYVDPPCFHPDMAETVIAAIKDAVMMAKGTKGN